MLRFRDRFARRLWAGPMPGTAASDRAKRPEPPEVVLLNRTDRPQPMPGEAEIKYLDGDFRIVRPGAFVRCAVTGVPIPLEELRYWSVDLQEAYATPEAVLQRQGGGYKK
jgi:hypothetical protein